MSALDTLERISALDYLMEYPFKYCLVKGKDKIPYSYKGSRAHPNEEKDFCLLEELIETKEDLSRYEGIGISIQASKICAIDVDKCFSKPFDISTIDDRGKDIIEMFKELAYIEFSFSGKGLRILFVVDNIQDYSLTYYIKNDKNHIEYYQWGSTARYVTITGCVICNNSLLKMTSLDTVYSFLNKYMQRPKTFARPRLLNEINNDLSIDELMKKVKSLILTNREFQDIWFMTEEEHIEKLFCNIQGKSKESTTDFKLLSLLFENVTDDKEKLREIFEMSPYFQSKDIKHQNKWYYGNYRYYEYVYLHL